MAVIGNEVCLLHVAATCKIKYDHRFITTILKAAFSDFMKKQEGRKDISPVKHNTDMWLILAIKANMLAMDSSSMHTQISHKLK